MKKIHKNLNDSIYIMHGNVRKIIERGQQIDDIEKNSEDLLQSSKEFMYRVVPWYKRIIFCVFCCPSWWFQTQTKALQEQLFDQEVISLE